MYQNIVEIGLERPDDRANDAEVCVDDKCASTVDGQLSNDLMAIVDVAPSGNFTWTATFEGTPETIEVRILDLEGAAVGEQTFDLDWVAETGYGNCPAPSSVTPVEVNLD